MPTRPRKHELVLDRLRQLDSIAVAIESRRSTPIAAGTARVAIASVRKAWPANPSFCRNNRRAPRAVSGIAVPSFKDVAAFGEQDLGSALDEDRQVVGPSPLW